MKKITYILIILISLNLSLAHAQFTRKSRSGNLQICSTMINRNGVSVSVGNEFKNECIILTAGDIKINAGDYQNTGTMIAGGNIIINGQKLTKQGFDGQGFHIFGLNNLIYDALKEHRFDHIQELIPSGYLIDSGSKILSLNNEDKESAYKAFLNASNKNGRTFLMKFAAHGDLEVVKWLLKEGADPSKKDKKDHDAAQIAQANGHPKIANVIKKWIKSQPEEETMYDKFMRKAQAAAYAQDL